MIISNQQHPHNYQQNHQHHHNDPHSSYPGGEPWPAPPLAQGAPSHQQQFHPAPPAAPTSPTSPTSPASPVSPTSPTSPSPLYAPHFNGPPPSPNAFSGSPASPLPVQFSRFSVAQSRQTVGNHGTAPQSQEAATSPPDGTPRFVPKDYHQQQNSPHHHPRHPRHHNAGPAPQFYGVGTQFPVRQNVVLPPPPNLDHFPPLGQESPRERPPLPLGSMPPQQAGQYRGQRQWRAQPPPNYYEQFFAEQAFFLDQMAHQLLKEITPLESEIAAKHTLLETLERICKQLCPTAKLMPFGSLVST